MNRHLLRDLPAYAELVCIGCWATEDDEPAMAAACPGSVISLPRPNLDDGYGDDLDDYRGQAAAVDAEIASRTELEVERRD